MYYIQAVTTVNLDSNKAASYRVLIPCMIY